MNDSFIRPALKLKFLIWLHLPVFNSLFKRKSASTTDVAVNFEILLSGPATFTTLEEQPGSDLLFC